ncbi:uncharacterized protein NPIL_150541 [Nephila pilipes]|uniref:C2H2-type domain-containing protein n=1 Tax=Nephila pilipes TaxID=299642 RepID=A0A8X6MYY9_NEPPI|nr:uncharacterized protein NPIL_150541 [Nephila pilipes]
MEHERPLNAYVCPFCKGSFDRLENLNKHVQQIHAVRSSTKENRLCPLCGIQCIKIEGYRNHLRHIHGLNDEGQVVSFRCFNDFLAWKNEIEKRNYCKYVMRAPVKKLPSNDKLHVYHCDSSVRSMKEKKSGVAVKETCPAVISAIESSKTRSVKIEHWNNHVGHIIPIEEVEIETAVGSLGTAEIILTSDHRFSDGQSTNENIFFISESNDGSFSESFVKEPPKRITSMFQSNKSKLSDSNSRPSSQRFSYKKDPTKKSGSFNYSLASVACMKSSTKKKTETTSASTTSDKVVEITSDKVIESTNDAISAQSTQVALDSEKGKSDVNIKCSSNCDSAVRTENIEDNDLVPFIPTSTKDSDLRSKICGQVVLVNSITGEDDKKMILSTGNQKIVHARTALPIEQIRNGSLRGTTKDNSTMQAVVVQIASEKEKATAVQNILNISQNSDSPEDEVKIVSHTGPSNFKRARKSLQKPIKKNVSAAKKKIAILGKQKGKYQSETVSHISNSVQKSSPTNSSVPKIQGIITIDSSSPNVINSAQLINTDQNIPVSKIQGIITIDSGTSNIINSVQLTSSASSNPVTDLKSVATSGSSPCAKNIVTSSSNSSINSANQVMLNSFPPGQAFMSINNNLIPIGSSAAPLLQPGLNSINPGFMLASPVAPSPFMRPIRPLINFSPLAPRPPLISTSESQQTSDANTSNNQTVASKIPPGAVPVLLIPQGNQISSTPVGGVTVPFSSHSNAKTTISTSIGPNHMQPVISVPKHLTNSGINPVLNSHLLPGTQLISSTLLPSNAQFIPAPLLTNTGQHIHGSFLQNNAQSLPSSLIGQPGIAPVRSIISTTVSNAIKVQKVQLPFTRNIRNPTLPSKNNIPNVSEKTKVSNVVLNTEPISSTPAISVPSISTATPQKPGTLIFESSGDVYMLEPVEDSVHVHLNTPILGASNRVILPAPPGYKRDNADSKSSPETEVESTHDANVNDNLPGLQLEKAIIGGREAKIDVKLKSPRRNKEVKNGVQIKSVLQEKRPLKDDDVEILKKVKYYQMEMKYLASQAECKRLRLELVKAQKKNKDPELQNITDMNSSDIPTKQDYDVGILHIDLDKDKPEQDSSSEIQIMDVDTSDKPEGVKVSVKQIEDIDKKTNDIQYEDEISQVESENLINENNNSDLCQSDTTSNNEVASDPGSHTNNFNMENHSCGFEQDEENSVDGKDIDNVENQSSDCVDNGTGDIESEVEKSVDVDKSDISVTININECHKEELKKLDNKLTNFCGSEEETKEINNQILENFDAINEDDKIMESCDKFTDDNELNEESLSKNAVKKNLVMNNNFCHQLVLNDQENLKMNINENFELNENTFVTNACDTMQNQDTLKKLESKYGKDKPLDVYTMIRTSVLRSLYDDMKTLCAENKKFYEELQKFRSRDKFCEIDKQHDETL